MGNLGITAMPMVWLFFLFAWTASANQQTLIPPQEEFSVEISKQVQLDFEAIDPLHRSMQTDEDLGLCYDALFFADENQDRKVDKDEFITFVQLLSPPDFLADVGDFNDLPLILRSNFVILACLCLQGGTDPQCCVGPKAHISNKGAFPGEFPTSSQEQYLYLVCFLTKTSIDRVMQSMAPSLPPALAGTASPSAAITRSPVDDTTTPTSFPSAVASSAPSVMHSDGPSVSPSESPVAAPSTSPSYGPSAHPSKSPTPAPSKSPSRRPSNSPSELPSLYPSEEHSRGPSSPPSDLPSEILSPETRTPTSSWPTSSSDSPTVLLTATDSEYPSFIEDQGSEAPAIKETDPPSSGPSAAPTVTMQPTREVSMSPSSMSSELRPDAVAKVSYLVAVRDNFQMRDYVTDLVLAMDRLAPDVAFKLNISSTPDDVGRHLLVTVHVDLPTSVDGVILSSTSTGMKNGST